MIPIYTPNENDVQPDTTSFNVKVVDQKLKQTKQILDLVEPVVPLVELKSKSSDRVMYSTSNIVPRLKMASEQLAIPIATGLAIMYGMDPLVAFSRGIALVVKEYA